MKEIYYIVNWFNGVRVANHLNEKQQQDAYRLGYDLADYYGVSIYQDIDTHRFVNA